MSRLIVRFHDSALDNLSWSVDQADDAGQLVNWQAGTERQLSELAKKYDTVVLVIAQQNVYLTDFEIPSTASRRVLAAVEFQIEDQLAQDVELLHVALGDQSKNPVAIAVLEKSVMQRCIDLIQKHGLQVAQVVPEIFLCPWSGITGEVNLITGHEAVIMRYGEHLGIKCKPELCETMLDLIAAEQDIKAVNCYLPSAESFASMNLGQHPGVFKQLKPGHHDPTGSGTINLLQRRFQISSIWSKLLRSWKGILGLLLVLVAVTGYNKAIALQQLEVRLSDIKAAQYEQLKDYLPASIDQTGNLKNELINLLKQAQSANPEANFLELLHQFTQAKKTHSSIIISRIGYQNKRLSIDITSDQLSDLESLLEAIESTGQAVKMENLNIKPGIISGRYVLDGASR
jgi:general secretion pathway protein L